MPMTGGQRCDFYNTVELAIRPKPGSFFFPTADVRCPLPANPKRTSIRDRRQAETLQLTMPKVQSSRRTYAWKAHPSTAHITLGITIPFEFTLCDRRVIT